jgi:SAM-dependent methyltransferase
MVPHLQRHKVSTVLDMGCGTGYDALTLAQLGFEVSGNDISEVAIQHARHKAAAAELDVKFVQHDIATAMPYGDGSFDAVICNLTLHMFPPDIAVAITREVSRCLSPQGLFLFHVNSTDDIPYRSKLQPPVVALNNSMFRFGKGQTMRFFSETACRELLEDWELLELKAVQMLREDGSVQKCAWRCVAQNPDIP